MPRRGATRTAAVAAFERALAAGDGSRCPTNCALSELAYGEFLRRSNQRRAAAARLAVARDTFETLGARPALERSERELRGCGLRPASRKNPDPAQLTPSELAVARLVSQGLANREIAAELMLSVRTIEFHLSNVYKKLDLRSRGQLAAHMNTVDHEVR